MNKAIHQSVLLAETIEALQIQPSKWYIDATFGRGGHTREIINSGGNVIAFDVDHQAIEFGQTEFSEQISNGNLVLVRENFDQLKKVVSDWQKKNPDQEISGVLFDFGTSADQLLNQDRGFSFSGNAELDMRMDTRLGVKAKDLLAVLPEKQLTELFLETGGESQARSIAKAIATQRKKHPIVTSKDLSNLISRVKPMRGGKLHPATKVFQALRIAVNTELASIETALPIALELIKKGTLVTISFHEGEDRIAKNVLKKAEQDGHGELLPLVKPSPTEIEENPRARSAKMRVFKK
jgi:16S rRNA (cytosine1402-N4)-methyltransferase